MVIYHNNIAFHSVEENDSSYRYQEIMGEDYISLRFSLSQKVNFPLLSYVRYSNEKYTLYRAEDIVMNHTSSYDYELMFHSEQHKLKIWKFYNTVDNRLSFPLTDKPVEHLNLIVDNLNKREGSNVWSVGDCIDDVEKVISYDYNFIYDALKMIAGTFETEFYIDCQSHTINLGKVEFDKELALPLRYGKNNGLVGGVKRKSSSTPVERLYVQGGERNINYQDYPGNGVHSRTLLLPRSTRIRYDGRYFDDEEGFDAGSAIEYSTDALGIYVQKSNATNICAEDSIDCTYIYPHREGIVDTVDPVNPARNMYDIIEYGSDVPNYSDYLIKGQTMIVVFQSGNLAGKEFECAFRYTGFPLPTPENRILIKAKDIDGETMPNELFKPNRGDKYSVFNVMLPTQYITSAEVDMLKKAIRKLYELSHEQFEFSGKLDSIFSKRNWIDIHDKLRIGKFIKVTDLNDSPDGVSIRIKSIKTYLNNEKAPELTLSNELVGVGLVMRQKIAGNMHVITSDAIVTTQQMVKSATDTIYDNVNKSLNDITNTFKHAGIEMQNCDGDRCEASEIIQPIKPIDR